MRRLLAVGCLATLCGWHEPGCRAPTEYTLVLTTDVKCTDFRGLTISTGRVHDIETTAPAATEMVCDAQGNLGTLVVVPSGARNEPFAVKVVAGLGAHPSPVIARNGIVYEESNGAAGLYAVTPRTGFLDAQPFGMTGAPGRYSPAMGSDGTLYVGAFGLFAVKPDGSTKWAFPPVGATSRPAFTTLRWTADASVGPAFDATLSTGSASAVIDGTGAVFVAGGPGKFRAFSADGKLMWEFISTTCRTCRFGSPAIGTDGTIYVPADALYAFAP